MSRTHKPKAVAQYWTKTIALMAAATLMTVVGCRPADGPSDDYFENEYATSCAGVATLPACDQLTQSYSNRLEDCRRNPNKNCTTSQRRLKQLTLRRNELQVAAGR